MKNTIRRLLIFIWRCWFYLLATIGTLVFGVFWFLPLAISHKTYKYAYKGARAWSALAFYGAGFRYNLKENKTLKPNQSYIIIANHTSLIDIPLLFVALKNHPFVFVGKKELTKIPVFGYIYKKTNIIVDRSDPNSRRGVYRQMKEKTKKNISVAIFPEGGVPDDESIILDDFKDGAFSIAISSELPIAVFSICGLKKLFPFDMKRGRPGKVDICLKEILETKGLTLHDKKELKEKAYQLILEDLMKCEK